jgi:HEAT repeat protein
MKKLLLGVLGLLVGTWPAGGADVTDLVKKLKDSDNEVRRRAAQDLGELGGGAKDAVPALVVALKDRDLYVRRFSAQALGKIGSADKTVLAALGGALNDDRKQVREAAVGSLGKLGAPAVPVLTQALNNANADVQEAAVAALAKSGPAGVTALSGLVRDSKKDAGLRLKGVNALREMGKKARAALPALIAAMKEPRGRGREFNQMRVAAAQALGVVATREDAEAIKALEDIVGDAKLKNNQLKNTARRSLFLLTGKKKGKK